VDILLLETLIPEAMAWLSARHSLSFRPDLAHDPRALAHSTNDCRAVVLPRTVMVTQNFLDLAPKLEAVARLHVGTDNTDLEACRERGVRVVQANSANVRSNAEFLLASLMMMYRRGFISALMGNKDYQLQIGREINGSTIGILGLSPTAHTLAGLLNALGARVIGYDPAVHHTSPLWVNLRVQPVSLLELMSTADAVSVQMHYASRFKGFINDNVLGAIKPGQKWVATSRSSLFDPDALARALLDGRIEGCLLDGVEKDFLKADSPLLSAKNLYMTPRIGSHTVEARERAGWYVAHRLHDALASNSPSDSMVLDMPGTITPAQWGDSSSHSTPPAG
jgi:phosphoglycerate dehydrogenase-like enzyme